MKQTFLAALCVALSWRTVQAQADTVHFDDNIPANWTANATSVLSLSTDHLKGGTHSLKWAAAAGDTLQALSLGIGTDIGSSSHFYIYNPAAGQDTLIVQFLDAYSFDVRSVKKTCVHIVHPDGRLIPFDTYNLFYRDQLEQTRLAPLRARVDLIQEGM